MGFSLGLGLEAIAPEAIDVAAADAGAAAVGGDVLAAGAGDVLGAGAVDAGLTGGVDAGLAASLAAEGAPIAGEAATGAAEAAGAGAVDAGAAGAASLSAEGALPEAAQAVAGDIGAFGGPAAGDISSVSSEAAPFTNFGAGGGVNMPISIPAGATPGAAVPTGGITPASQLLDQSAGGSDVLGVSGGDPLGGTAPGTDQLSPLSTGSASGGNLSQTPMPTPDPRGASSALSSGSVAPAVPPASSPAGAAGSAPAAAKGVASAAGGGAGGGGGFDWWKAAGLGLAAAPLAITLGRGEQPLPPQAGQLAANNTGLQNFANSYLSSVTNNQPTPAQAAQLATDKQALVNQWRQALFNQGVQNPEADSRWPQIMAQIDQQIQQETQSFIQTNLQAALSGSGQASNNLIALANMQIQQDAAFQNAISGAGRALGGVAGLMGR